MTRAGLLRGERVEKKNSAGKEHCGTGRLTSGI